MKTCALFLMTAVWVFGETISVGVVYPELALKNGTVLTGAKILSFDPDAGSVNVLTGKTLKKLDAQLLPDDVLKQLEKIKPRYSEAEKVKLQQRAADAELAAQKLAARREEAALAHAKATREAQLSLAVAGKENEQQRDAATEELVARAAETYAQQYFRYESDPHSSVGLVLDSGLRMGDPEVVPGWTGRWRVPGTAGLAYATNTGGSLGRKVKDFEVLVEIPQKGSPKIIELRVK